MTVDASHGALRDILAGATAEGWYICNWATLRASTFPGVTGWSELKEWCARHDLECAVCFSQASRRAEVQFRKRHFRKPRVDAGIAQDPVATIESPPAPAPGKHAARDRNTPRVTTTPPGSAAKPIRVRAARQPVGDATVEEARVPSVVGIPWHHAGDYPRLLAVIPDASELPADYATWAAAAEVRARELHSRGVEAIRVPIDPETLLDWCKAIQMKPDAEARQRFANEKAFHSHLARQGPARPVTEQEGRRSGAE